MGKKKVGPTPGTKRRIHRIKQRGETEVPSMGTTRRPVQQISRTGFDKKLRPALATNRDRDEK